MDEDNQNCSSKSKSMHEEVAYKKIEEKNHEFLRKLYSFIRNYHGQLPNLKDIFQPGVIDWLLMESVECKTMDPRPLVDFVIRTGYKDEPKVDKDGKPLLHRATALTVAARDCVDCWDDVIPDLFKIYDRFDVNYTDDDGYTHFHTACKHGYEDVVGKFLELGQDPNCIITETGDSPLHLAVGYRCFNVIELLMKKGADMNLTDNVGYTPLHIICEVDDDDESMKMIFDIYKEKNLPVQVNAQDKFGNTPLHLALAWSGNQFMESLLRNGADPNLANEEGLTPLHRSSQNCYDDYEALKVFFEVTDDMQQSVQIDARDKLGRTPLQLAVANLNPNVVDILLDHGADLTSFVFPTESYFGTRFDLEIDYHNYFQMTLASGALGCVENLEKKGYELDRGDTLTIMKFFAKHGLFKKSTDLKKCRYDDEVFASKAKKIMIRDEDPSLSLNDLIRLRPEEAVKRLTYADYYKFSFRSDLDNLPKKLIKTCAVHLCEMMSRGFFRRWALDLFLELTRHQLPILCCEMIIGQLMNEDLCNICLATAARDGN